MGTAPVASNDKASGELLVIRDDGTTVSESGATPDKIDAGFFQSIHSIRRHGIREFVFFIAQFQPTGSGR